MQTGLDRLPIDIPAVVVRIDCRKDLKRRLKDFGLVVGTEICCRYRSPDGGVTALEFRGSVLALRTADIKGVRVEWI